MMKKLMFLLTFVVSCATANSQNLNGYKYASVPLRFSFVKEKERETNKYNLTTLSKLFMEKYGFETYVEGDMSAPYDFLNNNCNKVFVDLERSSNMFITRLKVVLKDCNGKVLYTSKEGTSKEKVLNVAYNEALRGAFASFAGLNHKYDEKATKPVAAAPQQKDIVTESNNNANPELLFAQPIQNGFQLVNSEPRIVYKIFRTSNKDIYAAVKGNLSGVFIPKGNEWFFEYYQNDKLVSEKVNVKF